MGATTEIAWTESTWNPTTGCDRCSPGCDSCYIERTMPFRIEGRRFDENGKMGVRLHPKRLETPTRWRKPRLVFVNSLSDLFHEDVPDEFIVSVFDVMGDTPRHTFQVLTKRPQRMAKFTADYYSGRFSSSSRAGELRPPFPNVWLGTSIENDRYSFRADHLRRSLAAVRFLSCEPLIGPIPSLDLTLVDWVIVGGESGPGARAMELRWARSVRDVAVDHGVPVFVKQLGTGWPERHSRDLKGGDITTFPTDLQLRQMPVVP